MSIALALFCLIAESRADDRGVLCVIWHYKLDIEIILKLTENADYRLNGGEVSRKNHLISLIISRRNYRDARSFRGEKL